MGTIGIAFWLIFNLFCIVILINIFRLLLKVTFGQALLPCIIMSAVMIYDYTIDGAISRTFFWGGFAELLPYREDSVFIDGMFWFFWAAFNVFMCVAFFSIFLFFTGVSPVTMIIIFLMLQVGDAQHNYYGSYLLFSGAFTEDRIPSCGMVCLSGMVLSPVLYVSILLFGRKK